MPALKRMLSHFDCELDAIPATRYNEIIQEAESKEAADYWYEETFYTEPDIWELDYF